MGIQAKGGRIESIDNPADHQTFIRLQWPQFAALAWRKYQSQGRGAIVIDLQAAKKSGANLDVPSFYVSDGSESLRSRGGWPSPEIADTVNSYDPELDVVFLVIRLDGDCFCYNVSDEPEPRRAASETSL
jgi:hypothetical protein